MSALAKLKAVAADPTPRQTARQIIEARLGRPIGPINDMPRDLRDALYRLEKQIQKVTK